MNDDSIFGAEEGSSQRENAMKRAAMIARMYAMFEARADAINARQDAQRTAFYDAQDAKLKALQDDITALQLKRLAEKKALNGSDHDGKIAIPASAPDALPNVLATPTKPKMMASPTSIIESTSATNKLQSLEPKKLHFAIVASKAPSLPEPESPKLADVEFGSTKLKIGTAHGESEKGEQVKSQNFAVALSHDAILRTPEQLVDKTHDINALGALFMAKPPPPYVKKHVAGFQMGEYDRNKASNGATAQYNICNGVNESSQMGERDINAHADPATKPEPTALTTDNGCDDVRLNYFF